MKNSIYDSLTGLDMSDVAKKNSIFNNLSGLDMSDVAKKKNGLTYLPWATAWGTVATAYPEATWKVVNHWNEKLAINTPYVSTELGIMVTTEVTIENISRTMQLPVLNSSNKALKSVPYTIESRRGPVNIPSATMFDINTAIMRCLVKNIALFGLGLYIYEGEDTPIGATRVSTQTQTQKLKVDIEDAPLDKIKAFVLQKKAEKMELKLVVRQVKTAYSIDAETLEFIHKTYKDGK